MKLDWISYDGVIWDFSQYFDYIDRVADAMPRLLRDYAVDIESYALHGAKTLHDSRLLSAVVDKRYDSEFSNVDASLELCFVDQYFEGNTTLRYGGVYSYSFREMDLSSNQHADVLVHEFAVVTPERFRHRIIFDHSGEVEVEFRDFAREWKGLTTE